MEGHSELPNFNEKIAYYQLYSSTMHFTFWRVEPGIIDPNEPRYQPEGSCYIPISKLLAMDYTPYKDDVTNINYQKRNVDLQEKLWAHGK